MGGGVGGGGWVGGGNYARFILHSMATSPSLTNSAAASCRTCDSGEESTNACVLKSTGNVVLLLRLLMLFTAGLIAPQELDIFFRALAMRRFRLTRQYKLLRRLCRPIALTLDRSKWGSCPESWGARARRIATTAARSSAFHGALTVSIQIGIGKGHSNHSLLPTASLSSLYGPLNLEFFQKILLDEECRGGVPRVAMASALGIRMGTGRVGAAHASTCPSFTRCPWLSKRNTTASGCHCSETDADYAKNNPAMLCSFHRA